MAQYQALTNPETRMPIKCPNQKDAPCNNHCAWFDNDNNQCAVLTISGALTRLAQMNQDGRAEVNVH
jgi:hypothetical protein